METNHIDNRRQTQNRDKPHHILRNCRRPYPNIKFRYTSTKEVEKIIKLLKTKNAQGYDEISVKILKWSAPFISSPLTYICNKSLETGSFPSRLKYSTVKPIFKTGNRLDIVNFRPISLLISFSKIFEKIIALRIQEHIDKNQIVANEQYGFRRNVCTDNASYTLTHEILSAINNKLTVGGIFCDLSKAFDCVNHRILLSKLEYYGIRGTFRSLIDSCLKERYQRVVIKNKTDSYYSNWELIKHGVPQGSILGPLLFLLYMNDITEVTAKNAKLILYADDTSLIVTSPSPTEFATKLNNTLVDTHEWFKSNLLFLNFNKTNYIQFITKNSQKPDLNITLTNNQITSSTHTKFLGLTIEETLSWKGHINQILPRLSSAGYAIRVITPLMTEDTLKMIYHSYVHSIITYGIIFWGNSSHSIHIFKMQKRIIRVMTKSKGKDSCRQLFKRLEILPLKSQYILSVLQFVVKNKKLFTTNQEIHNLNTRCNINLHPPICNLTLFQKGVQFSGIKLFNHLPPNIKSLSNEIKPFTTALKRFLLLHSFYSVEEYLNYRCNK